MELLKRGLPESRGTCFGIPVVRIIWGFPKIRGTILGVPIIRTIVFWGLHWGPPILGNYHMISGLGIRMAALFSALRKAYCYGVRGSSCYGEGREENCKL